MKKTVTNNAKCFIVLTLTFVMLLFVLMVYGASCNASGNETINTVSVACALKDQRFKKSIAKPNISAEELKRCGRAKSVNKLTKISCENFNKTDYGTVDWSTAAQGYITFAAAGRERCFILQGPNADEQVFTTVSKDQSAKIELIDDAGRYQYAIANKTAEGTNYIIQYKNSFNVG